MSHPGHIWAARGRMAGLAVLALGLTLASAGAQAPQEPVAQAPANVDPAYLTGYNAGYAAGQDDHAVNAAANPHKFHAYQAASEGYTKAYGALADYQRAFRGGFEDGYNDSFQQRPRSVGTSAGGPTTPSPAASTAAAAPETPPAPGTPPAAAAPPAPLAAPAAPAPAAAPSAYAKHATGIGYREGYSAGEYDANRNSPYDFTGNTEYRLASAGYGDTAGDFTAYQNNFRSGFRQGYDDGYHHRLYNSQVGVRNDAMGPGGPGLLPTNPEVARARPSGVYDNGDLIEEGTLLQASLDNMIGTKTSRAGDPFTATITVPVWVGARLAIPAGAKLKGVVAEVQRGGLFHGGARLQLRYDSIEIPGSGEYSLHATTAGVGQGVSAVRGPEGSVENPSQTGQNVKRVAAPAVAGAIIGGIFGGGRGAAVLGSMGGAMGAAGVMVSRKRDLNLHIGEYLAVRLDRPLELRSAATAGAPGTH